MTRSNTSPGIAPAGKRRRARSQPVTIELDPPVNDDRLLAEWDQKMRAVEREQETASASLHRLVDRIGELARALADDDGPRSR